MSQYPAERDAVESYEVLTVADKKTEIFVIISYFVLALTSNIYTQIHD